MDADDAELARAIYNLFDHHDAFIGDFGDGRDVTIDGRFDLLEIAEAIKKFIEARRSDA